MSVIRRLEPLSDTRVWWTRMQNTIEDYQAILRQMPTLNSERPNVMSDRIQILYVMVQHSQCPDSADEIYTHVTRSMINLGLSYESVLRVKMDDADVYYERAMQDWFNATRCFAREGIMLEA